MAADSDTKYPSQKAVKSYIDTADAALTRVFKNGVITRAFASASGAVTTAHGVGSTPSKVRFTAFFSKSSGIQFAESFGVYNGTTTSMTYFEWDSNGSHLKYGTDSTNAVYIKYGSGGADIQAGVVTVDGTNITLTWTKTGSTTTGDIYIVWEAEK